MSEPLKQSQTRKNSLTKGCPSAWTMDEAAGDIITRGVHGDLSEATEQPHLPH